MGVVLLVAGVATRYAHAAPVDLNQFSPDSAIIGYSVYSLQYTYLPSQSGLADGGLFGSAGLIELGDNLKLRAPRINVRGNFLLGSGTGSQNGIPNTYVGGNFELGSDANATDTIQVQGTFVSVSNTLNFAKALGVRGNLNLSGNSLTMGAGSLLRMGGTYSSPNMGFGTGARAEMAAAAGGPAAPGGITYNKPWTGLLSTPVFRTTAADLPGNTIVGYTPPTVRPDIDLSGPAPAADAAVQFLSPTTTTARYWKCSNAGLPAGSCNGDTLLPGYYGNLIVTGNSRAILLGEGFYSFLSITIGGSNAIIAAQPRRGRTVVYSEGDIGASSSHAFIGPDSARLATGLGTGANQFLGGTMMVASAGDIRIPSDNRIWATLSAPTGTIHFSSQVMLFGQAFADSIVGDNNIDFGAGAFIPFRGLVPALFAPKAFTVSERVDPACVDPSGIPCRDTTLVIRLPYTTAYTVRAKYSIVETSPRQAIQGEDFLYDTGRVVIAAGDSVFTLQVRIFGDSSYEAGETFRVVFDSVSGAGCPDANGLADTTIKRCEAVGTIIDDDLAPRVRIDSDSAIHEGDTGTRPSTFTVRLIDPVSGKPLDPKNAPQVSISFRWRSLDSSATVSDNDYVQEPQRRDTLALRGVSKSISVAVRGDTRHERDEAFLVLLDSLLGMDPVGSILSDSGLILNDDSAPGVRIGDVIVREPARHGDTAWALFPLSLSRTSGLPVVLQIGSADSTARSTVDPISGIADYRAPSLQITIPADRAGDTLRIPVFGDTLYEKGEAFKALLLSAVNAVLDDSVGVGSIIDADSAPTISIDTAWVVEPASGRRLIVFRTHLSRPSGLPASVTFQVLSGTATSGLDYIVASSTGMNYRAGLRDTVFTFDVLSDSVAGEETEDLTVSITFHDGLRAGITTAKGYIVDAQGLPMVSIADAPATKEGDTARFRVTMDYYTAKRATVRWTFVVGTADSADVKTYAGEVVFEPGGSKIATIAIPTVVDTVWEPTETFTVRLSDCDRCRIGDSSGLGTLLEEGEVPRIFFQGIDTTVVENRAGTVRTTIGLTRAASIPLTAALLLDPTSTASRGADWSLSVPANDTLVFAPGSRRIVMQLPVVGDTLEESTETVILNLSPLSPLAKGSKSTWKLTIIDDDHRPVVDITRPVDSLRTNVPGHTIEWKLDGTTQPTKDTTLVEGWNRIERTFVDTFGHVARDVHMVWGDFTPPEVHVFKIVGKNPLHPERDTTWWGDRARTRFGVDTIWYWVRDSAKQNDGSWKVFVDTLFAVTDFKGDGVFPTQVKACDDVGNCGIDTGWIDLKQSIPDVTIDNPRTGQRVKPGDVPVEWHVVDGGKTTEKRDVESIPLPGVHLIERCWTDDVGNTGCDTTRPVADTSRVIQGRYVDLDGDGRVDAAILTLDVPWAISKLPAFDLSFLGEIRKGMKPDSLSPLLDSLHMLVPVVPPYGYGLTGFKPQTGWIRQSWISPDSVDVVTVDSFRIVDGVAPVIVDAEVRRVENYKDPDTIWLKTSEPVEFDADDPWLQVGSCPSGKATCDTSELVWNTVRPEDVSVGSDGRVKVLVQPGDSGSVRPGYVVRFLPGVADSLGNHVDSAAIWATVVRGVPRPDLVKVDPPTRIPVISTAEQNRSGPGGILIRASRGTASGGQWWEPGRGYLEDGDSRVQDVCPNRGFCSGPSLYINRPVRMVIYVYDLAGTYAISRSIDITKEDIESLQGDKIDRLHINLEWNHRSETGEVVGTGVYVWRIVAQTRDRGQTSGIQNIIWKTGVKVPRE